MSKVYVSDVLESLLGANDARKIVRSQCKEILNDLDGPTQEALRDTLYYISGKCMGYPSLWFISQALELNKNETEQLLRRAPEALYISLTTSITDDFLDLDESPSGVHMMLVYMFFFEALKNRHWFSAANHKRYVDSVYPLVKSFASESLNHNLEKFEEKALHASSRIGAFFETIGEC